MDSSLDSIWDEPVVEASPKRTNDIDGADDENANLPRPAKRPRTSLFFSDSEDEVGVSGPSRKATHKAPPVQEVDIDALFADFDDDEEALKPLPPTIDEEEMTRQAEARHRRNMPPLTPHEIMPSSSPQRDTGNSTGNKRSGDQEQGKDEKKARRRIVKLDENRLLGPNGFPHLIKMTKDFRIKGKGHEATDLSRILQIYQYWTHELYPKTQFLDTVERVEKLCHSRRMNVSLSVWRDEAHGRPSQRKDIDDDDDDADLASGARIDTDDDNSRLPRSSPSLPSSRASSPPPTSGAESDAPPQTRAEDPKSLSQNGGEDDDEAFWRSLDEFSGNSSDAHAPPPAPAAPPSEPMDDDEDMWDIIDEVEQQASAANLPAPPPAHTSEAPTLPTGSAATGPPAQPVDPADEWDDMYL